MRYIHIELDEAHDVVDDDLANAVRAVLDDLGLNHKVTVAPEHPFEARTNHGGQDDLQVNGVCHGITVHDYGRAGDDPGEYLGLIGIETLRGTREYGGRYGDGLLRLADAIAIRDYLTVIIDRIPNIDQEV